MVSSLAAWTPSVSLNMPLLRKSLYLVIDGSSQVGMGYVLLQRIQETDPIKVFSIVSAGSSLLPTTKGEFLPVESEMI